MLRKTSAALDVLVRAAESPQVTTANLTLIAREAAEIQVASREFWRKIRDVRANAAAATR